MCLSVPIQFVNRCNSHAFFWLSNTVTVIDHDYLRQSLAYHHATIVVTREPTGFCRTGGEGLDGLTLVLLAERQLIDRRYRICNCHVSQLPFSSLWLNATSLGRPARQLLLLLNLPMRRTTKH